MNLCNYPGYALFYISDSQHTRWLAEEKEIKGAEVMRRCWDQGEKCGRFLFEKRGPGCGKYIFQEEGGASGNL